MSARTRTYRYAWLGGPLSRAQVWTALAAVASGAGAAALYLAYLRRGGDVAPDSAYGYGFALSGTLLLALVGAGYWVRKRRAQHARVRLHTWMAWHIAGACLGVALIFMHAAGNFHPRTGTYALYGLIAVIVSGVIGRALDRIAPRLAARAALGALSGSGEERLEELDELAHTMTAPRVPIPPERAPASGAPRPGVSGQPWDVAYFDLDPEVEAIPGFFAGAPAAPTRRSLTISLPHEVRRQAAHVGAAMSQEAFWVGLVRVWRRLHLLLSLVFLGLLLWHIEFAITLLWNAR